MAEMGKVWLVGAGPGSVDLLTVKARRLLYEGDCIVYDRLVGEEVLGLIPLKKELIAVGKSAGKHATPGKRFRSRSFPAFLRALQSRHTMGFR